MNLRDKFDNFEIEIGLLTDFCELIEMANDVFLPCEQKTKLIASALRILSNQARSVEKMSDELFINEQMRKLYYSNNAEINT